MATKMLMPLLGQTMEEGTIIKWFKSEGDRVESGEPLLEVMTDKANMEVEASTSGVLRKIIAQPNEIIPIKEPICIIGTADEPIDNLLSAAVSSPAPMAAAAQPEPVAVVEKPSAPIDSERVVASPAAKRIARENGVELSVLAGKGTGPGGRIVEQDVLDYVASTSTAMSLAEKIAAELGANIPSIGRTIPYSGIRKAVGDNVAQSSRAAPHVTLVAEVDMTECIQMRKSILPSIEKTHGVRISLTDIIIKAATQAIEDHPIVNSSLSDGKIVIHDQINIGIATAIEDGLVVPVVRDVQSKKLPQISREIKEVVAKARDGKAGITDYQSGTFTVTNLGSYGIGSFNPIITPGQSAILGVGRAVEKPVVINGEIQSRSMMNLCLSFDHRVMDGAPAAKYLSLLKEILESPYLVMI